MAATVTHRVALTMSERLVIRTLKCFEKVFDFEGPTKNKYPFCGASTPEKGHLFSAEPLGRTKDAIR